MRYAKKLGFAGVPGAVLDRGDIGRAVSFFADEDRKAGSVALGSLPATSSDASCSTCATPSGAGVRLSDRIASKMFREMGAAPLAAAAVDGADSPLMARAGALAAGLSESLKLRTDKIAVLSSLTSPMFAKAVDRTTLKLHGLKGNDRFASALTLGFLMGATDDHAKRPTFYADAYRKAAQGMTDVLSAVSDPALRPMSEKVIAMLGTATRQQTPRQLAGLGFTSASLTTWSKVPAATNTAPLDTMVSSGILSRGEAAGYLNLIKSTTEWRYAVASADPRDIGTATRSPASIMVVPTYATLTSIWQMLVMGVQTTVPAWDKTTKRFGNNRAAAIENAKQSAGKFLDAQAKGSPQLTKLLLASWIVKNYADRINNYSNSGIGSLEMDKYKYLDFDNPELLAYPFEGTVGLAQANRKTWYEFSGRYATLTNDEARTRIGLYTVSEDGSEYRGVASRQFAHQCMVAYYTGTEQTKQHLLEYLANSSTSFPVVVGYALALARRDALERSGQIGSYGGDGGFEWIPNPNGVEQVPKGTEAYADWSAEAGPNQIKVRFEAIPFVVRTYQDFYKREPTRHAIGWYGRMGYGLGEKWYDIAPDDIVQFGNAITGKGFRVATDLPRKPENERLAGAELSEQDAKDRSNWFAILGDTVGGVLSSVIGLMAGGLEVATDLLCKVFKWLFGESAGGVICSIVGAIIKYMVGAIMGATAALFAIIKAIALFISELTKGEPVKAFKALLLGVNQAIFFVIGGPFAAVIGGDEMPFLKSQEKELREKATAAGRDPNDVLPSLETLAEAMTSENPFFIFDVIFSVIDIVTSAGVLLLKAAGRLTYALCPVMGYVFGGKAMKAIKESTDPDVAQWKKLTLRQVRTAITSIAKLIAAVVMGILAITQAIKMLKDPWKRYVARKGGTASAIMSATGSIAGRIDSELLIFFAMLIPAAKNGFKDTDPCFILMKDALSSMWKKAPQILIGFITDELLTEDERKAIQPVIDAIANSVEEAQKAFESARDILYPESDYGPITPQPLTEKAKEEVAQKKAADNRSKALLPIFALAAGLVVGFMFAGGSDGA